MSDISDGRERDKFWTVFTCKQEEDEPSSTPTKIPPSATNVATLTHLQLRTDYTPEAHTALELQRTTARI
jgi:hypothetical protein